MTAGAHLPAEHVWHLRRGLISAFSLEFDYQLFSQVIMRRKAGDEAACEYCVCVVLC